MTRVADETRRRLLETAFHAIHESGFQSARLDAILGEAGVTKGALYHHFPTKKALGLAVVDEVIRPWMTEHWIAPLARPGDPLEQLRRTVRDVLSQAGADAIRLGCPLNNIAQEMAPLDEDFRRRVESIFDDWRFAIAAALKRGQAAGHVAGTVDPAATAAFLVAAFEGGISTVKSARSMALVRTILRGLDDYIRGLAASRARAGRRSHAPARAGRKARAASRGRR